MSSGIQVSYLFCLGSSEDSIRETVREFHIQTRLSLIGKSIGKVDEVELDNN